MTLNEIISKLSGNRKEDFSYLVNMIDEYPQYSIELGKICYNLQSEEAKSASDSINWILESQLGKDIGKLEDLLSENKYDAAHLLRESILEYLLDANMGTNLIDCYDDKELLFCATVLKGVKNSPTIGNISYIIKNEVEYLISVRKYDLANDLVSLLIHFAPLHIKTYNLAFSIYSKMNDLDSQKELLDNMLSICVTREDLISYYTLLNMYKKSKKNLKLINHLKLIEADPSFKSPLTKESKYVLSLLSKQNNNFIIDFYMLG